MPEAPAEPLFVTIRHAITGEITTTGYNAAARRILRNPVRSRHTGLPGSRRAARRRPHPPCTARRQPLPHPHLLKGPRFDHTRDACQFSAHQGR